MLECRETAPSNNLARFSLHDCIFFGEFLFPKTVLTCVIDPMVHAESQDHAPGGDLADKIEERRAKAYHNQHFLEEDVVRYESYAMMKPATPPVFWLTRGQQKEERGAGLPDPVSSRVGSSQQLPASSMLGPLYADK